MMQLHFLLFIAPLALAQAPVYLRQQIYAAPPATPYAAAPVAMLQCAPQCMPSCLPSCSLSAALAQNQPSVYQPYDSSVISPSSIVQPAPAIPATPITISEVVEPQPSFGIYQPYGPPIAQYPVIVPVCAQACMPACAPTCVVSQQSPQSAPLRDDLPTPPPEVIPTPTPEIITTPKPVVEGKVIPCKCLIKITITQGSDKFTQCGPNSCTCPQGYNKCGNNCCKA